MKKVKNNNQHSPGTMENVQVPLSQSSEQMFEMASQSFYAGKFLQAEKTCQQILKIEPNNADANHLLGIIASQQGNQEAAIQFITRAIQHNSSNAEFHKNLGIIFKNVGRLEEAVDSFKSALSINSDYVEVYNILGVILKNIGKLDEAIDCFRKVLLLKPDFAEAYNNLGNTFLDSGRMEEAIENFKAAINVKPDFSIAHYNLGTAYQKMERIDDAIACYKKSLSLNPRNAAVFNALGGISQDAGKLDEARTYLERALSLDPDFAGAYKNLGQVYKDLGKMSEAVENYKKAIYLDPDFIEAHLNLGIVYKETGRMDDAMASFKKVYSLDPEHIGASRNLAVSVKHTELSDFILEMDELYRKEDLSDDDRMHLGFSLGKVYEDLKDHEKAMGYIIEANKLKRKTYEYSIQINRNKFAAIKRIFTPELFSTYSDVGIPDETPIFILGMPRSGTTLVEQILASHPRVFGAGELQILSDIIKDICSGDSIKPYPKCVMDFDVDKFVKIGADYIDAIRNLANDADYITDKLPHNFLFVGLIKIIMPKAKVIHCSRNPMDNCLSIFKIEFKSPHNYAYDMVELGQYYNLYLDLMDHWEKVLPNYMHTVKYEEMVSDQENQTRKLLDFCGLDWNDSCLAFHETKRVVKTASFAQVRRPMYKDSVELWKIYEMQLEPLYKAIYEE